MNVTTSDSPEVSSLRPSLWHRIKAALSRWASGGFVPMPITPWEWWIMRLGFAAVVFHTFLDWHPFK